MYALNTNKETLKSNVAGAYQKQSTGRIQETGAYNAMIDCAVWEEFNGWKKLVIYLVDENESTGVLEFPYSDPQGERMFGADSLDALMVCGGIRTDLTKAKDTVMRWSPALKSMNEDEVDSCPELKGKWYKFLLRKTMDAYINKNTGETKEYSIMQCAGIYQHKTDLSAVEIIDKVTQGTAIISGLEALEGYPLGRTKRHKELFTEVKKSGNSGYGKPTPAPEDLDSELPF